MPATVEPFLNRHEEKLMSTGLPQRGWQVSIFGGRVRGSGFTRVNLPGYARGFAGARTLRHTSRNRVLFALIVWFI